MTFEKIFAHEDLNCCMRKQAISKTWKSKAASVTLFNTSLVKGCLKHERTTTKIKYKIVYSFTMQLELKVTLNKCPERHKKRLLPVVNVSTVVKTICSKGDKYVLLSVQRTLHK